MSGHVALHPHEHEGHLLYTEHGRSPYFAWGSVLEDGYDWYADEVVVEIDGDEWECEVKFNPDTGLKPKPEDAADERLNEYWIKAYPVAEDDRRKLTYKLSPRWSGQETIHDNTFQSPFQHDRVEFKGETIEMADAGVDVEYRTSNLSNPRRPAELLPELVQALAKNGGQYIDFDYFQDPHPMSNVKDIEGYVRHRDETQDKLVETDGVLMRIFHLLGDRLGSEVFYEANNEQTVGHRHRVKVDQDHVDDLLPGQLWAKQFKSYHPKDTVEDGPLSHPKFGVLVKNTWQSGTVYFDDLDRIWQEIEEAAINVLSWAGIQTGPGGPWVADDHFEPEVSGVEIERFQDPLPAIEASQQAHVLRLFTDATDADQEILGELATNGGQKHHVALEEASGYSSSTLYRMLHRVPELVESDNGIVSFASERLYQDVKDILDRAEREVSRASEQVGKLLGIDAEVLDEAQDKMRRFMQRYAADIDADGATLEVSLNTIVSEVRSAYEDHPKLWIVVDELRRALQGSQYHFRNRRVVVEYERPDGRRKRAPIDGVSAPVPRA